MAEPKLYSDFGIEKKVIDIQLLKSLRYLMLGQVDCDALLDCVKYFIYDRFYVIRGKNFTEFEQVKKDSFFLEPNLTYLILPVGSQTQCVAIHEINLFDVEDNYNHETINVNLGDVVQVKPTKLLECVTPTFGLVWEVKENSNLDDWLKIDRFIDLISKPSWTDHFPTLTEF